MLAFKEIIHIPLISKLPIPFNCSMRSSRFNNSRGNSTRFFPYPERYRSNARRHFAFERFISHLITTDVIDKLKRQWGVDGIDTRRIKDGCIQTFRRSFPIERKREMPLMLLIYRYWLNWTGGSVDPKSALHRVRIIRPLGLEAEWADCFWWRNCAMRAMCRFL